MVLTPVLIKNENAKELVGELSFSNYSKRGIIKRGSEYVFHVEFPLVLRIHKLANF